MFLKLRNNFIAGLLVILPAVLTVWILRVVVGRLNAMMLEPIVKFFRPYLHYSILVIAAKMAVFLVFFTVVALLGAATKYIVTHRIIRVTEKLFLKVPMLNKIYSVIKDMSNVFLGQNQQFFRKVVLLEYPRKGLYSIGFITAIAGGEVQEKTKEEVVNVFIPTTPNPTSGVFLLVPKTEITPLTMTVEEGLKLVISGGAVMPQYKSRV